ncbi:RUTBC2 [Mytilus edulis]|uniref:SGSM1 n=1 Tax=Mytilus edulis TaxID=6550 RepID=A0A8S3RE85_MYTED|nr:RUTBC2 [Mytilus edulis]
MLHLGLLDSSEHSADLKLKMEGQNPTESENRQNLLRAVKKEVKQIMEEAVTRKFVHEESSSIISLSGQYISGAVEACLLHGLRKRALGLFKLSTTTALLQKLSKSCEPAAHVLKASENIELAIEQNNSTSQVIKTTGQDSGSFSSTSQVIKTTGQDSGSFSSTSQVIKTTGQDSGSFSSTSQVIKTTGQDSGSFSSTSQVIKTTGPRFWII